MPFPRENGIFDDVKIMLALVKSIL